jgi:hypothetical protein
MKLNYGKTFLLGFGFFGVSLIWGVHNAIMMTAPFFMIVAFFLMAGVRRGEAVSAVLAAG